MPFDQTSDDQIIVARAQRRRVMFVFLVSFVLLIAAAGFLILAAKAQVIPVWLSNILIIALLLAWLGFFLFRVKSAWAVSSFLITSDSYQRKTIDMRQRHVRYWLLYVLACILGMGFLVSNVMISRRPMAPPYLLDLFSFVFAIVVLLGVLGLAYGPSLFSLEYDLASNDELSRAQRAQATQLGYIFTVMEFCAVLVVTIYRPQFGLALLPSAIATAVAVPGFYFLFLEWRANRS